MRSAPIAVVVAVSALSAFALGCGGSHRTQAKAPSPPADAKPGKTALTAAELSTRVDKVLVADKDYVAMVGRKGCHALLRSTEDPTGGGDEMRVRCPRPERLQAWFDELDKAMATLKVETSSGDVDDRDLPVAEVVTATGVSLRLVDAGESAKMVSTVKAFGTELEAAEQPAPGPASPGGWQMMRVMGGAHVLMGGEPTRGVLDARVSTNGQYFCEFVAMTEDGPIRATKSGWISPGVAARAVDEVLGPFQGQDGGDRARSTFASATKAGAESRAGAASTAAVFERFAPVQDALGDACLPELEPPESTGL